MRHISIRGDLGEVFREDYREDFHEPIELGPRSPTLYTLIDNIHIDIIQSTGIRLKIGRES